MVIIPLSERSFSRFSSDIELEKLYLCRRIPRALSNRALVLSSSLASLKRYIWKTPIIFGGDSQTASTEVYDVFSNR